MVFGKLGTLVGSSALYLLTSCATTPAGEVRSDECSAAKKEGLNLALLHTLKLM